MQFTTVADSVKNGYIKALVYSEAGLGKTVLSSTLGDGTVLVSAESGTLSLRKGNLERMFGVGNKLICYNMPIIVVKTLGDFYESLRWCAESYEARSFHSVAIDSITEIAEVILNTAKRTSKDPRQAYGELVERMETIIRAYRDLNNKHVYMAAKSEPTKDMLTGVIRTGPAMPGQKLGPQVPYFFDEVFRLGVGVTPDGKTQYRFLQTQPDLQNVAKDRSGALASMEEPHLGKVFAKILAS